ncbi:MAG: efflux RND transporter periplasmic adaptor subunit [Cyclobacteriaceae bacterium]|nr:efflux RND transporter periplasmic adaptor subunit [Cyclobacteriaceae bacterium SS2]
MNKTVKRILYIGIVIVILGAIIYPKLPDGDSSAMAGGPATRPKLTVDGLVLAGQELKNQINITGTILADESVLLNSEVAGKVSEILFEEGQFIKKGKLLVKLNDDEIKADLERLRFILKLNEDNEYRQKQLLEKEAISREEYETALTTLNTSQAEIRVLQARLEKHYIKAPFDGIVGLRSISVGSYLNPGTAIAELFKIDPVKVEFSVPSKYLQLVNVGDRINFSVDAYPDEVFNGEIYAVEPQVDPQTRSIRIRALANNKKNQLYPGQFARINLILEVIDNALLIPTQAVIPELNGKRVFTYKNGKVVSQSIETGLRNEENVQVATGLSPGDTVITTGVLQINHGSEVNIRFN